MNIKDACENVRACKHLISGERSVGLLANRVGKLNCSCGLGDHEYEDEFEIVHWKNANINLDEYELLCNLKRDQSAMKEGERWEIAYRPIPEVYNAEYQGVLDKTLEIIKKNEGFWVSGDGTNFGKMTGDNGYRIVPIWLSKPEGGGGIVDPFFGGAFFFMTINRFVEFERDALVKGMYTFVVYDTFAQFGVTPEKVFIPIGDFKLGAEGEWPGRYL